MYKQKQATIKSVTVVKESTPGDQRPWTLYQVIDSDEVKYKTFAHRYTPLIGQSIPLTYEEKEVEWKGKKIINRNLIEPNASRTPTPKAQMSVSQEELITAVRRIDLRMGDIIQYLDRIDEKLNTLGRYVGVESGEVARLNAELNKELPQL